jgi:hypothetical protein
MPNMKLFFSGALGRAFRYAKSISKSSDEL